MAGSRLSARRPAGTSDSTGSFSPASSRSTASDSPLRSRVPTVRSRKNRREFAREWSMSRRAHTPRAASTMRRISGFSSVDRGSIIERQSCIAWDFAVPGGAGSGVDPVEHPREGDALADVLAPADPRDRPLEPQTEAGVRDRAVAPEIEVPGEGLLREVLLPDPRPQELEVVLPLAPADQLAGALGPDEVDAEHPVRVLRV